MTGAVEDVNKDVNDVDSRLTRPEEALAKHLKKRRKLMPSETAQDDLFAAMGRQEPRETPKSTPQGVQDASEGSGGTLIPLGTGSDSRAVMARNPLPSAKDPRDDNAWIPQRFDIFWAKYPRKVAKADAKKAFSKLIKAQEDVDVFMKTLLASVDWWKTQDSWIQDRGKYIPYPATWLNAGHWEDARTQGGQAQGSAQFLAGDVETDDDLIRRMTGG